MVIWLHAPEVGCVDTTSKSYFSKNLTVDIPKLEFDESDESTREYEEQIQESVEYMADAPL